MKPSVLMTHPRYFAIKGGANPHTRNADDTLKKVDSGVAIEQWNAYVDVLLEAGVDVYVADGNKELTGMVFAANAGFLMDRLERTSSARKRFFPSHFAVEHRMGETDRFSGFMNDFGVQVSEYPEQWSWEGEADAFPLGRGEDLVWVFTYGYRSDPEVCDWISGVMQNEFISLRLVKPEFYHGDTAITDLGHKCLVYLDAFDESSQEILKETLGDRIIEIEEKDAKKFLGNSLYIETEKGRFLFVASGIRKKTLKEIAKEGIEVIEVDVSEFFGKGGGGPKCMVFHLGYCDPAEAGLTEEQSAFRHARHIGSIRKRRGRQAGW